MRRPSSHLSSARPARRGFSFVEILFAVAVMGIGFIMIAAVFPIGLQQTKLTLDETAASAAARAASARLQQLSGTEVRFGVNPGDLTGLTPYTYPATGLPVLGQTYPGQVRTFNDPRDFADGTNLAARRNKIWQTTSSDFINSADSRNGAVMLYKRDAFGVDNPLAPGTPIFTGSGTAQLIVVNAQIGNESAYKLPPNAMPIYPMEPRPVAVQIGYEDASQNYVATFFSVTELDGGPPLDRGGYPTSNFTRPTPPLTQPWDDVLDAALGSVTEGAFVVISDDRVATPAASGRLNGRIVRLGARRPDLSPTSFDLAPGYGFTPDSGPDGVPGNADDTVAIGLDTSNTTNFRGVPFVDQVTVGGQTYGASTIAVGGSAANKGAVALVLGRGFVNAGLTPVIITDYTGPAQDVSIYTTFVTVAN